MSSKTIAIASTLFFSAVLASTVAGCDEEECHDDPCEPAHEETTSSTTATTATGGEGGGGAGGQGTGGG